MVKTCNGELVIVKDYASLDGKSFVFLESYDNGEMKDLAILSPFGSFKLGLLLLKTSIMSVLVKK